MHVQRLGAAELRVLGCLIEKQRTTPEQYPLTLNALRLACNQSTSRDPVTDYDEETVRAAAQSLGTRGYARLASGPGSRTPKYRQLFQEALDLMPAEVSILAVLMLRGPQTAAELKTRTARLFEIDDTVPVLAALAGKELVRQLPRLAGRREERWAHLLEDAPAEPATESPPGEAPPLELRLARLEDRVAELERLLAAGARPD
jgi:uncharacterized protein